MAQEYKIRDFTASIRMYGTELEQAKLKAALQQFAIDHDVTIVVE